jgi:hypothetical protein
MGQRFLPDSEHQALYGVSGHLGAFRYLGTDQSNLYSSP